MNKFDRITALLIHLQSKRLVTAGAQVLSRATLGAEGFRIGVFFWHWDWWCGKNGVALCRYKSTRIQGHVTVIY